MAGKDLHGNVSAPPKGLEGSLRDVEKALSGTMLSRETVLSGQIRGGCRVLRGALEGEERALSGTLPGTLQIQYAPDTAPEYAGPYEVMPKVEAQTLETAGRLMKSDIKVNRIPENYGLISYNQDRIITIT